MLIFGQKSCILGPTIFKIPQPIIVNELETVIYKLVINSLAVNVNGLGPWLLISK